MKDDSRPVTMKEVAAAAGVSEATVSRALRNSPNLKPETCARIQKLAKQMNYTPNPMVSALMEQIKTRKSGESKNHIAFVTRWDERDGWRKYSDFQQYFEGATARAEARGYKLESFWMKEPGMTSKKFSQMLYTRNIQGLILAPQPHAKMELHLDWNFFSAVTLGYTLRYPELPRVTSNHHGAMVMTLANLHRLGYKRIGLVLTAISDERTQHYWLGKYLVYSLGLPAGVKIEPFVSSNFSEEKFLTWYQKNQPDSIIALNNSPIEWLTKAGVKVPDDVGVVSLSAGHTKKLSGINQRSEEIGKAAVDLLIGMLQRNERGIPSLPRLVHTPGTWQDGETTRMLVDGI